MMGNMYMHRAPAWLAAIAGIAFIAASPLSAAQSGKGTRVAMAEVPAPQSSSTQGHAEPQSGTGPTVPRPCGEQVTEGASAGITPQGGGKAAPACVDTPDQSEDKGKPRSVGAPDQNGLPGAGAAAGAGGSIDERSR